MSKQGLIPGYTTRYDIVEAWYWWLNDRHESGGSSKYARLSKMSRYFKPSPLSNGPDGEVVMEIYDNLCDGEQCEHERLCI
jgi:hypothetical protein